jgi:hypothetical protein
MVATEKNPWPYPRLTWVRQSKSRDKIGRQGRDETMRTAEWRAKGGKAGERNLMDASGFVDCHHSAGAINCYNSCPHRPEDVCRGWRGVLLVELLLRVVASCSTTLCMRLRGTIPRASSSPRGGGRGSYGSGRGSSSGDWGVVVLLKFVNRGSSEEEVDWHIEDHTKEISPEGRHALLLNGSAARGLSGVGEQVVCIQEGNAVWHKGGRENSREAEVREEEDVSRKWKVTWGAIGEEELWLHSFAER